MKIRCSALLAIALTASFADAQSRGRSRERGSSSFAQSSRADTGDFTQDYAIFSELNIFQRERHSRSKTENVQKPLTQEETFVLTGIVQDLDNQYRANFENRARGGVQKVSVGSPLAHGAISEIRPDQACYEAGGKKVWVQIGSNLTGANAGGGSDSNDSNASNGPPIDPNAPGLSLEQRMRARRMQQVTGGGNPTITSNGAPSMGGMPMNSNSPGGMPQMNPNGQPPQPMGTAGDNVNGPPQQAQPNNGQPTMQPEGVAPADAAEPNVIHNFPALPTQPPTISPQGNY